MIRILTLIVVLLPVFGFGQIVATWNFYGASEVSTWDATAVHPNMVQAVTLTRGLGAPASPGSNSFRTTGFGNDGIDVANDDYFEFQLEVPNGYKMSLNKIDGTVRGTSSFVSGAGVANQFAYSLDGTTFNLIGSPHIITANPDSLPATPLSVIQDLQDIPDGTTVTFRFYASGQTTTGGWGFTSATDSTQNLRVLGDIVFCDTIAAPTVSNLTICGGNTAELALVDFAPGSVIYWYDVPSGGSSISSGTPYITPVLTASNSYWVESAIPGCPASPRTELTVTVSGTTPIVSGGVDQTICRGEEVVLAASGASTLIWNNGVTDNVGFYPNTTKFYAVSGTNGDGCFAVDTVLVTVNPLPVVTVTTNGATLTALMPNASHQWINCADNSPIPGANTQSYTATANGSYKVKLTTYYGCVDTSACVVINQVGLSAKNPINSFSISPNPTKGKVTVTASGNELANVLIFNALGKEIARASDIQNGSVIDLSAFNNGVYMIQITTNKESKVQRIVKH